MKTKADAVTTLVDELNELRLFGMAASLESLYHSADFNNLDRISFLQKLIEPEYESKTDQRYKNRLKRAHLTGGPQEYDNCKDSADRKYLPSDITTTLSTLNFIADGLNICILGPSDSGKSYLAKALGIKACTHSRVGYYHCESFLEEMVALKLRDYQAYQKQIRYNMNLDLLILDDFLLHTISDEREVKVLFEVMEKRSELSKSTIVCSQREPSSWPSMIMNDEVSSNAIMKRATKHYTVVIEPKADN
ncbi:MAG: ATP-binding protein [Eubacteriales bacterium]|nr:ATP-binding protein [Eubacteriales bacterium]